jgi:hypothetical protein
MAFSASLSSAHQIKRLGRHHKKSSPATAACSGSGSGSGSGSATPTVEPARLGGTRWLSRGAPPPAASEREVLTLALDHFVLFVASCAARLYHPYTTRGSNPGLAETPPPPSPPRPGLVRLLRRLRPALGLTGCASESGSSRCSPPSSTACAARSPSRSRQHGTRTLPRRHGCLAAVPALRCPD